MRLKGVYNCSVLGHESLYRVHIMFIVYLVRFIKETTTFFQLKGYVCKPFQTFSDRE